MDDLDDIGRRVLGAIGEKSTRTLLRVLTLDEENRVDLITRTFTTANAAALAEVLVELEADDRLRSRMIEALRRVL